MSQSLIRRRRPIAIRVALLSAAAAFLFVSAGAATANESENLIVEPGSAEIGDVITVTGKSSCGAGRSDASVNVYWNNGDEWATPDADGNWSHDFDTTGADEGTYHMNAACVVDGVLGYNYAAVTFTLTAPVDTTTTTTTEAETSTTEAPTTEAPTTEAPAGTQQPDAATPAVAVTSAPNYTG